MMFLKRDFDEMPSLNFKTEPTPSFYIYIFIFYNATEGDNTEYYDVEGAALRRTTNISVCNVLPWILKPMNV